MKNFNLFFKTFLMSILICALPFNIVNSQTWGEQSTGITNDLHGLFFFNASNGIAVGEGGVILSTSNGGGTWTGLNSPTSNNLLDLDFTPSFNYGLAVGINGTVVYTNDMGLNLTMSQYGSEHLNAVIMASENIGYIVGNSGVIYKTEDGGDNWALQLSNVSTNLNDVFFVSETRGHAVGQQDVNSTILITTDGGDTWTNQNNPGLSTLNAVHFINNNIGIAVGNNGTIMKTENGGTNWSSAILSPTANYLDITFVNDTIVYITGTDGVILVSTDQGDNWSSLNSTVTENLNSIFFVNFIPAYIAGNGGTIVKTCPYSMFTASDGAENGICANTTVTYTSLSAGASNYYWLKDGDTISTAAEVNVHFDESGTFMITLITANETCSDTYQQEQIVHPLPQVDLGNDTTVQGDQYELDAGNPGASYEWYHNGNKLPVTGQTITVNADGLYKVNVTDDNGCMNSDEVNVQFSPVSVYEISQNLPVNINVYPNPSENGIFKLDVIGSSNYNALNINVYNIHGKLVYHDQLTDKSNIEINLDNANQGVYLLEISNSDFYFNKKLIIY